MSAMFRSFSATNYRIWFTGALVSNIGTWMQGTAQNWVVLTELSNDNAAAMGITMALQFAPPLLLVGVTGLVADRFDRRKLLVVTQLALLLLAIALGTLLLTGAMTLPLMYVFALLLGCITAFDNPARQAFVSDLVDSDNTSNAVALNSASFNVARMIGPAVAGAMIVAVGTGWVFIANSVTFLAMLVALLAIDPARLARAPRPSQRLSPLTHARHRSDSKVQEPSSQRNRLSDGVRYVAGRPDLLVLFAMVFLMGAFGMNFPIFASTMALEFGREADGYGLLSSILAIGSLAGALLAARRERARLRVLVLAALGFAVASTVSALMPSYLSYAITLVAVGFFVVTMLTTANGYVQTTTEPALRGRVLALYMAVLMGGAPLGSPIAGWVAATFGPRAAILLGAASGLVAFAIGTAWLIGAGRLHLHPAHRFGLKIDATMPISLVRRPDPEHFSDELAATTPIRLGEGEPDAVKAASTRHPHPRWARSVPPNPTPRPDAAGERRCPEETQRTRTHRRSAR